MYPDDVAEVSEPREHNVGGAADAPIRLDTLDHDGMGCARTLWGMPCLSYAAWQHGTDVLGHRNADLRSVYRWVKHAIEVDGFLYVCRWRRHWIPSMGLYAMYVSNRVPLGIAVQDFWRRYGGRILQG
jgi:hypothetical protein